MQMASKDSKVLKAIGDDTRLRLIYALLAKPQYISQLADDLKMDRGTISYNLSVLEDTGILDSDYVILDKPHSKGRAAHVYSINVPKLRQALDMLKDIRQKLE